MGANPIGVYPHPPVKQGVVELVSAVTQVIA